MKNKPMFPINKSRKQMFNPSQEDIEAAKVEYFSRGGTVTKIVPDVEKLRTSDQDVYEWLNGI